MDRVRARLEDGSAAIARRMESVCVSIASWKRGQRSMVVPLM